MSEYVQAHKQENLCGKGKKIEKNNTLSQTTKVWTPNAVHTSSVELLPLVLFLSPIRGLQEKVLSVQPI